MDAMEEIPLVDDVEICSEEEEQPAGRRFMNLGKLGAGAGVLALMVFAYVAAQHNGNESSAQVADTIGRSDFGSVSVHGGQVQMGDHNSQSNIGGDQTVIHNSGNYVAGTNKGSMVGTNYGSITNTVEAKKCEGSGNGFDDGAAQVVCCYSPSGQSCCGEATAVGGRRLGTRDVIKKLEKQFMDTTDSHSAKLILAKIRMLKGSSSSDTTGPKRALPKHQWPGWASKLPKTSTGGQCPQGSKSKP